MLYGENSILHQVMKKSSLEQVMITVLHLVLQLILVITLDVHKIHKLQQLEIMSMLRGKIVPRALVISYLEQVMTTARHLVLQ